MVETQIINNSVENINSSVGFIGNSVSLVDQAKDVPKEVLYDYAIKYLTNHTYINSKKLAIYYICELYNLTPTRNDFNKLRVKLTARFRIILSKLITEGKIAGYSPNLYKRVELTKPIIDTNKSHLVFHQGKFVNPKYYDLD